MHDAILSCACVRAQGLLTLLMPGGEGGSIPEHYYLGRRGVLLSSSTF
jgi:hypothetical protein